MCAYPLKIYVDPFKMYVDPFKICKNPFKIYDNPFKMLGPFWKNIISTGLLHKLHTELCEMKQTFSSSIRSNYGRVPASHIKFERRGLGGEGKVINVMTKRKWKVASYKTIYFSNSTLLLFLLAEFTFILHLSFW